MHDHSTRIHNMKSGRPRKDSDDHISRNPSKAKRAAWYRDRERARSRKRYESRRAWFDHVKSSLGCQICGEIEPVALDIHHLDHTAKEIKIASNLSISVTALYEELSKCAVLCSNCHRKIHYSIIDDSGLVPIDTSTLPHPKSFADNSTCAQSQLPLFQGVFREPSPPKKPYRTIPPSNIGGDVLT